MTVGAKGMLYPEYYEVLRDSQNRRRTLTLFGEHAKWDKKTESYKYYPLYSLRESPMNHFQGETLPSAKEIYIETRDPTEYKAAILLVGSWEHWEQMRQNKTLAKHFDEWHRELQIIMRSEAIEKAKEISKGDGAAALAAAKYLDKEAQLGTTARSPEDKAAAKEAAKPKASPEQLAVNEDWKRLMKGKKDDVKPN